MSQRERHGVCIPRIGPSCCRPPSLGSSGEEFRQNVLQRLHIHRFGQMGDEPRFLALADVLFHAVGGAIGKLLIAERSDALSCRSASGLPCRRLFPRGALHSGRSLTVDISGDRERSSVSRQRRSRCQPWSTVRSSRHRETSSPRPRKAAGRQRTPGSGSPRR